MRVCVIGLGKIGLPLAAQYASKGAKVVGCDVSPKVVESVNSGVSHVLDEPGLSEKVKAAVEKGLLSATTDTVAGVRSSEVVVVIVPLVVDPEGNIDYGIIDSVTEKVSAGLQRGSLVIYETTLPVGTTRKRLAPILEKSGMKAGEDFYLVFSPERVSSGVMFDYLKNISKLVGGVDEESTRRGVEFYRSVLDSKVIPVSSCEAAEAAKLFDMVYRDINIAVANEFAKFCDAGGVDANEVIEAANTNPFSRILLPGVGVGGHCAPVYPHFLIKNAADVGVDLSIAKRSRRINDAMPKYTAGVLKKEFGSLKKKNVLVLGLAYRGNVKETFMSPSIPLVAALNKAGANVSLSDPLFSDEEIKRFGAEAASLHDTGPLDAVVLAAYHREYRSLDFRSFKARGARIFVDGRNVVDKKAVEAAGLIYRGIGRR
jgi:nucleotide sugar dehydrogenase